MNTFAIAHIFWMDFNTIQHFILARLSTGLDKRLSYHGVHHTKDVLQEAVRIASSENLTDEQDLLLLKVASLFHDSGFLLVYKDHEDRGCHIAREFLPSFGASEEQLQQICGMIRATKIPQQPKNFLEEIICDADLDYLGRDDFYPIGKTLYHEWKAYGFVKDEEDWNRKQVRFLEAHHYFTGTSVALRSSKKAEHLSELKNIIATYSD